MNSLTNIVISIHLKHPAIAAFLTSGIASLVYQKIKNSQNIRRNLFLGAATLGVFAASYAFQDQIFSTSKNLLNRNTFEKAAKSVCDAVKAIFPLINTETVLMATTALTAGAAGTALALWITRK